MRRVCFVLAAALIMLAGCAYGPPPVPAGAGDTPAIPESAVEAEADAPAVTESADMAKPDKTRDESKPAAGDDADEQTADTGDAGTDEQIADAADTEDNDKGDGEEMDDEAMAAAVRIRADLVLSVGGRTFYPDLEDNSSAEAFVKKLESGPLKVEMSDYGPFEKVGDLPWELPTNDSRITTVPGDIILYQGNKITIYYDENTWEFTRLGRIPGVTGEELQEILGEGSVTAEFWLEWSE